MSVNFRSENALARSNELIAIGNKNGALSLLVEVICSRWQPQQLSTTLDPIMFRAIELSVQLRKVRPLKDAMQQYKNLIYGTNSNVSSSPSPPIGLEDMIKYFITTSQSALDSLLKLNNNASTLNTSNTLITINQSNLTNILYIYDDQSKEESSILKENSEIPELFRFIWESYKCFLDMMRHSLRLQSLYGTILNSTIEFCLIHERKVELRRLSDLLRHHLTIMVKFPAQNGGICLEAGCPAALAANLTTSVCLDSLRLQLSLRFSMLSSTSKLLLWQESFKLIEDIHGLFLLARRTPPTSQLILYYENLALIFRKSEDSIFLATTLLKLFTLNLKSITLDEGLLNSLAHEIIISILSIPLMQSPVSTIKTERLSQLLGLKDGPPSLSSLLREINFSSHSSKILELVAISPSLSIFLPLLKENITTLSNVDLNNIMKSTFSLKNTSITTITTIQKNIIILYIKGMPLFSAFKLEKISKDIGIPSISLIEEVLIEGSLLGQINWVVEDEWTIHLTKIPFSPPPTLIINDSSSLSLQPLTFSKFSISNTEKITRKSLEMEQKVNLQRHSLIAKQEELNEDLKIMKDRKELLKRQERILAEQQSQKEMAIQSEKKRKKEKENAARIQIKKNEEDRRLEIEMKKEILKKKRSELEKMIAVVKRYDYQERALREEEIPLLRLSYEDQITMDRKAHQERQTLLKEVFISSKAKELRIKEDAFNLKDNLFAYYAERKEIHCISNQKEKDEHENLLQEAKNNLLRKAVEIAQKRWQWDRDDAKAAATASKANLIKEEATVTAGPAKYLSPTQRKNAALAAAASSSSATGTTPSPLSDNVPPTNTRWRK